jgi:hypothetical protein
MSALLPTAAQKGTSPEVAEGLHGAHAQPDLAPDHEYVRGSRDAFIRQIPGVVGVGVSGAPGGEKDEVCANAGLVKIEAVLR